MFVAFFFFLMRIMYVDLNYLAGAYMMLILF